MNSNSDSENNNSFINSNNNKNNIDLDKIDYLISYLQKIQNQEITLKEHINNIFNEFQIKINSDYQKNQKKINNKTFKFVQNFKDEVLKINNNI